MAIVRRSQRSSASGVVGSVYSIPVLSQATPPGAFGTTYSPPNGVTVENAALLLGFGSANQGTFSAMLKTTRPLRMRFGLPPTLSTRKMADDAASTSPLMVPQP